MRSGFISVVGRPNVGKSTLVNALVGEKVAITSSRPQTTRNTIRGVLTIADRDAQLVFVDTPGLHKPKTALGERLNKLVYGSLAQSDVALFLLDATQRVGPGDRLIAQRLGDGAIEVVVVVNKVDIASDDAVVAHLAEAGEWGFAAYVPASATRGDGLGSIVDEIVTRMPEGPFLFPPDMATDQPDDFLAGELIRENYLQHLREELPHSLAVVVEELATRESGTVYVAATLYVERQSQKGIVIGKGGELLRKVGVAARGDLELLFGSDVYLDLRVKVEPEWQRREVGLDRLGF